MKESFIWDYNRIRENPSLTIHVSWDDGVKFNELAHVVDYVNRQFTKTNRELKGKYELDDSTSDMSPRIKEIRKGSFIVELVSAIGLEFAKTAAKHIFETFHKDRGAKYNIYVEGIDDAEELMRFLDRYDKRGITINLHIRSKEENFYS